MYKKSAQHHLRTKLTGKAKRRKLPRVVVSNVVDKKVRRTLAKKAIKN